MEELEDRVLRVILSCAGGKVGAFGCVNVRQPLRMQQLWKVVSACLASKIGSKRMIMLMDRVLEGAASYNSRVNRERREKLMVPDRFNSRNFNH